MRQVTRKEKHSFTHHASAEIKLSRFTWNNESEVLFILRQLQQRGQQLAAAGRTHPSTLIKGPVARDFWGVFMAGTDGSGLSFP
jgi:hypothetical protein